MSDKIPSTPLEEIPKMVATVKKAFTTKTTISVDWRKQQLRALKACLVENWDSVRARHLSWFMYYGSQYLLYEA